MRRSPLAVLGLCAAIVAIHQVVRWDWMIDDAAIVFAFARNWVDGQGLVALPGGERVEGYSDPTWLALLALGELMGLSAMDTARPLGILLSVATLPLVWLTARRALPGGRGALLAPVVLTLNAQFSLWAGSGLENALFCLLLALGVHGTLVDAERSGVPWSALAWLGLVWTRPEGALYAGLALLVLAHGRWRSGHGPRGVLAWLALVGIPSLALEALRLWYFAWPLPNTAYAKLAERGSALGWRTPGWMQLRDWADRLWQGWLAPVYVVGLVGAAGPRARWALGGVAMVALALLWPGPDWLQALWFWPDWPEPPRPLQVGRPLLIGAVGVGVLALGLGRPGAAARVLCGAMVLGGMAFSVAVGGDWMGAYRWTSLFSPPLAVLFAVGVSDLADAAQRLHTGERPWATAGWLVASLGVGILIPPNLSQVRDHALYNQNPTPEVVKLRVDAAREWARDLHVEEPLVRLDVDMGGAMWWDPETALVDIAALVDVPLAHHPERWKDAAFIERYVIDERRPHLAFVPGEWQEITGLPKLERWRRAYVPLPERCRVCQFMWARRDLIVGEALAGDVLASLGGLDIHGASVPGPWGRGRRALLEVPVSWSGEGNPTLIAFLASGEHLASFDLPLGYRVLPPEAWSPGEVFRGRHTVSVPDLPPGTYDLGLVALSPDGAVLPSDAPADAPRFARGEIVFAGRVEIVEADALDRVADAALAEARGAAGDDRCDDAESRWAHARALRPDRDENDTVARALADCWARSADGLEPEAAAERLARSHRWDHRSPELARIGAPVAEALLAAERWEAVLSFQPWRAWARRRVEEAR